MKTKSRWLRASSLRVRIALALAGAAGASAALPASTAAALDPARGCFARLAERLAPDNLIVAQCASVTKAIDSPLPEQRDLLPLDELHFVGWQSPRLHGAMLPSNVDTAALTGLVVPHPRKRYQRGSPPLPEAVAALDDRLRPRVGNTVSSYGSRASIVHRPGAYGPADSPLAPLYLEMLAGDHTEAQVLFPGDTCALDVRFRFAVPEARTSADEVMYAELTLLFADATSLEGAAAWRQRDIAASQAQRRLGLIVRLWHSEPFVCGKGALLDFCPGCAHGLWLSGNAGCADSPYFDSLPDASGVTYVATNQTFREDREVAVRISAAQFAHLLADVRAIAGELGPDGGAPDASEMARYLDLSLLPSDYRLSLITLGSEAAKLTPSGDRFEFAPSTYMTSRISNLRVTTSCAQPTAD